MHENDYERQGKVDLLLALVVMAIYFVYMLTIAFAPELFAKPLGEGSPLSIGLASGAAMAVFMIAFSAWYTQRRNRRELADSNVPHKD
jgi:uncharacterized membrane protein (DUF485 family)